MRFCPHDFHGTTEDDLQQMSAGEDYWLYADAAGWGGFRPFGAIVRTQHDRVADAAHALAKSRNLIPYTSETFEALMQEVEATAAQKGQPA